MKNYVAAGDTVPFVASGAVSSGDVVVSGQLVGIATTDVADTETGNMKLSGVFEVPKTASQAWSLHAAVYWDSSEGEATTVASGNEFMGVAYEAVGSGASETLGKVRLNGIGGVFAPVAVTS